MTALIVARDPLSPYLYPCPRLDHRIGATSVFQRSKLGFNIDKVACIAGVKNSQGATVHIYQLRVREGWSTVTKAFRESSARDVAMRKGAVTLVNEVSRCPP